MKMQQTWAASLLQKQCLPADLRVGTSKVSGMLFLPGLNFQNAFFVVVVKVTQYAWELLSVMSFWQSS